LPIRRPSLASGIIYLVCMIGLMVVGGIWMMK
jgi:hypothetical protein